ncbi:beta-galactosidase [Candidatus Daviesbacteria bacterium]|nr:beta-galactosidase [Candidatus Daviesbacteria bacterium]
MGKFLKGFGVLLLVIVLASIIFENTYPYPAVKYGVTFSPRYAKYLNLDWQKTYLQILDDLKVKNLRIPAYWDFVESKSGEFDFSESDFMLDQADKRGVKVILTLGIRQPRWPECHIPAWAKSLTVKKRQQKVLGFVKKTVERYKNHSSIASWQVENEPLFSFFGEACDKPDKNFLKSEVELVKKLDQRPIIITDSGEFGSWATPMRLSEIFGISVYRKAYDPLLGYKSYPILPYFYNVRSFLTRNIFAQNNEKTIIAELQAEPWAQKAVIDTPLTEQLKLFSLQNFKDDIEFAKKTGFDEIYLWGVEWWYYMAQNGYSQYLEYAKTLFNN